MWRDKLRSDPTPWLLDVEPAGVAYLAHQTLRHLGTVHESLRRTAYSEGPIGIILKNMDPEGFWAEAGPGYLPKYRSSVWSLIALAQCGARIEHDPRLRKACDYILNQALNPDGQFSSNGPPSGTADCLQGNLCAALLDLGCEDERLDQAFEWMARTVTGDGLAPNSERGAALRYYAGKCGPGFACGANNKLPCGWGAAKVMLAFGKLPATRRSPLIEDAIQQGAEFLLAIDPATGGYPCGWSAKPSGNWWKLGFPVFYVTDILQIIEALGLLGFGEDPRLGNALEWLLDKQDELGRWPLEYGYSGKNWAEYGEKKQPNPWVTIRALNALQLCLPC